MNHYLKAVATLGVGLLLTATASACGADGEETAPPSEDSYANPLDELTSRMADGVGESGSVHFEIDFTGGNVGSASGDAIWGEETLNRLAMEVAPPLGKVDAILAADALYLNVEGSTPEGKYGLLARDNVIAGTVGVAAFQPYAFITALQEGADAAEDLGREEIDGEAVDHFRLDVDTEVLVKELDLVLQGLLPEVTVDVWLDDDDRIKRYTMKTLATLDLVYDFSGWGQDVAIQVPGKGALVEN